MCKAVVQQVVVVWGDVPAHFTGSRAGKPHRFDGQLPGAQVTDVPVVVIVPAHHWLQRRDDLHRKLLKRGGVPVPTWWGKVIDAFRPIRPSARAALVLAGTLFPGGGGGPRARCPSPHGADRVPGCIELQHLPHLAQNRRCLRRRHHHRRKPRKNLKWKRPNNLLPRNPKLQIHLQKVQRPRSMNRLPKAKVLMYFFH